MPHPRKNRESLCSVRVQPPPENMSHPSGEVDVPFPMYFRMYSEARRWGSGWERVGEKKKNSSSSGSSGEGEVSCDVDVSCGCCGKATIGT